MKKSSGPEQAPRLLKYYRETVIPKMQQEFNIANINALPRLDKIVVNMGIKEGAVDIKILDQAQAELAAITGQQPAVTRAKKSIAAFKLRAGMPVGLKVTLRKNRMYEFLDRLINIAMPRIRDFRGFSDRAFDELGNYSIGLQEQIIFPEIEFDKIKKVQGMNITFVTTAKNHQQSRKLLEWMGFPFKK